MRMSDLHTIMPTQRKRRGRNIPAKKRLYSPNIAQITRKDDRKFYTDRAPIRNTLN